MAESKAMLIKFILVSDAFLKWQNQLSSMQNYKGEPNERHIIDKNQMDDHIVCM